MTTTQDRPSSGDAIAAARRLAHQNQEELAQALTETTGTKWTRGMVAKLESGRKRLDDDTLRALKRIHRLPYEFYLDAPSIRDIPGYLKRRSHSKTVAIAA